MENSHFEFFIYLIFEISNFFFFWDFLKGLASNAQTNPDIEKSTNSPATAPKT